MVDGSGSMGGRPEVQARDAAAFFVKDLPSDQGALQCSTDPAAKLCREARNTVAASTQCAANPACLFLVCHVDPLDHFSCSITSSLTKVKVLSPSVIHVS